MACNGVGEARPQHDEFVLAFVLGCTHRAANCVIKAAQLALGSRVHVAHAADHDVRLVVQVQAVGHQLLEIDLGRAVEPWTASFAPALATFPSFSSTAFAAGTGRSAFAALAGRTA